MFNFLKYRRLYFLISAIVIGAGLFSIVRWGYIYSIDFVGGTNIRYQVSKAIQEDKIKKILEKEKVEALDVDVKNNEVSVRSKPIDERKEAQIRKQVKNNGAGDVKLLTFETVGPVLGQETIRKTLIASLAAIIGILIYISFAFKGVAYAAAAIAALLHDILVVIGVYSLLSHFFGAQLDTLFVTALLTTMSFSVHDTIVIFDKIREYRRQEGRVNIERQANKALTETMVRSLNNSMTIVFMLLALLLLGGSTIRFFVAALLIGTLTGTYSSPFVATPILVWMEKRRK